MTDTHESRVFPLLADPKGYVACQWDLSVLSVEREYWLGLFRDHFPHLLEEAAEHCD